MIAKYKERYFCVDLSVRPVELWRYDAVPTFKKCIDDQLVYYSRFVDIEEIDQIFDVGFAVKWDGALFYCLPDIQEGTAYLRTSDRELAEKHGFLEDEYDRGQPILWYRVVNLDDCSEFHFHKTVYAPEYFTELKISAKSDILVSLSRKEWSDLHTKTVYELSPWNFTNSK